MGSINDYERRKRIPTEGGGWRGGTGSSWKRRLLIQCAASIVLFLVVAAGINADNFLGRSARYIPLVSREEYLAQQSRRFLEKLCGGSLPAFAAALCDSGLSREELAELRRLLERDEL